jgi:hypothetical protein
MTPKVAAFLRKHRAACQTRDEAAAESVRRIGALNAKLIFLNGAGQLPRRGLKELDGTIVAEVKEAINGQ